MGLHTASDQRPATIPVQGSPGKSRDDTVGMRLGRVGQSVEWEITCNYLASCLLFFHKKTREKNKKKA